jgi:hypothetical protein
MAGTQGYLTTDGARGELYEPPWRLQMQGYSRMFNP